MDRNRPPRPALRTALRLVQQYDDDVKLLDDLIQHGAKQDGTPRGTDPGDPVARAAIAREKIAARVHAIEDAKKVIPEDMREVIFTAIKTGTPISDVPGGQLMHRNTYSKWRQRFLRRVAYNLYLY